MKKKYKYYDTGYNAYNSGKDYPFFIKLIKNLDFVEVKEGKKKAQSSKKAFLDGLKESIEELNKIKAGKINGISAKELLNDL